jgi:hypothetical protein
MPRRNRNAHSVRIDADELAAHAARLAIELGSINGCRVYLLDEMQLYSCPAGSGAGKSAVLRGYMTQWLSEHPFGYISFMDGKAVSSNGRV